MLADDIDASLLGERTETPAGGVAGGAPGTRARFVRHRAGGGETVLPAKSGPHRLMRGDRLEITTAGGGGWGEINTVGIPSPLR
jgi:N-methylhydantoinase B